jgi:hypothetical protein
MIKLKTLNSFALYSLFITLMLNLQASAQIFDQIGIGRAPYKGTAFNKKKPSKRESPSVQKEAILNAKLDALRQFVRSANFTDAEREDYSKIQSTVEANIVEYIPRYVIVSESGDEVSRLWQVSIKASIDRGKIELQLQKVSPSLNVPEKERSYIACLFTARQVVEAESFSAKTRTKDSNGTREVIGEEVVEDETSGQIIRDEIVTSVTSSESSRVIKSDVLTYALVPSFRDQIEQKMLNVFSDNRMRMIRGGVLKDESGGLIDPDRLDADFGKGDSISSDTRVALKKGCRELDLPYITIGTLTAGQKSVNPANGLNQITITVMATITSYEGRFPEVMAAVGPVTVQGFGKNQADAIGNGLIEAGKIGAKEIVAKLRNLGFK